jgi:hypothetical protein
MAEAYRITGNRGDMVACRRNVVLGQAFLGDPTINDKMVDEGAELVDDAPFPLLSGVRWDLDELEARFRSMGDRIPYPRSEVRRALDEQRFGQE